jgi:A/G-specific adenine glycosylase
MKKEINQPVFTRLLMLWNKKYNKRLMPWKGEKDPYKIWVSEIILQQTRVEQGMDYYLRFIKKYPTVKKLAAAADNEVFKIWEGLGYYSRCKNLLAAARFIVETHKGKFPENYKTILELKGVGPYTAAAIASFAYNLPHAVVDGNVNRVLARFFGITTPIDSTNGKQQFNELAMQVLDNNNAGLYNQAIMDFGATLCKPQLPHCAVCIMQSDCRAYAEERVNVLPVKEKKILKKNRWFYYVIAEYGNKFLVRKRTGKDIWQNLHEFILIETITHQNPEQVIESEKFKAIVGKKHTVLKISTNFKQTLTHQFIHAFFIHIKISKLFKPEGMEWIAKDDLKNLAFPKLINAYIEQVIVAKIPQG